MASLGGAGESTAAVVGAAERDSGAATLLAGAAYGAAPGRITPCHLPCS